MESKKILIIVGSVVAMFAFLFGAYALTSQPKQVFFEQLKTVKVTDHSKWSKGKNILIEYSDFQCPACAGYYSMLKTFEENPENKNLMSNTTFVYRNFPLDAAHPNARAAARAAEAASLQNKFFEYHDMLFDKQTEWSPIGEPYTLFETYARDLKLNTTKFKEDFNSNTVKEKVQTDYLSGIEVDVKGTPSFYLNGILIRNPQTPDELKKILLESI